MKKKKYIYTIGSLPKDFNLVGCKLGNMTIRSGWNKGFWLAENDQDWRVEPKFFKSFDEIKDWKVEVPVGRALELAIRDKLKI